MKYSDVQKIAKDTYIYIKSVICAGMKLSELKALAEEKMMSLGATGFWYWDVGAFVFADEETTLSVSGKNYCVSDRVICENDIITVDLSPQVGDIWGDYARTIIIEGASVRNTISEIAKDEWRRGLETEEELHRELTRFVTPGKTFEEVYFHMNEFIRERGYVNLDCMGNLGHSIEKDRSRRVYIEKGNCAPLSSVKYFTFEPHIAEPNGKYGYKKENIYYFDGGILKTL